MKKTRLFSMLLAASMAISSIPLMAATASAAEADDKSGNLLENAATNVTVNSVSADLDASGNPNKFVHTHGRIFHNNNDQGIYIYYELPEEYAGRTDLKLSFDMRVSVPVVQAANAWQAQLRYGFDVTNGGETDGLNNSPVLDDAANGIRNGDWMQNTISVTANTAGAHYVFFRKSAGTTFSFPMDIDNINLYYMNGDKEVSLPGYPVTDDFEDHVGMNVGYADPGMDDAYSYLAAPSSGNTTVTYTFAEPLTPGYYAFSGEMRLGTIIANWREGANNDNNTVINLFADDIKLGNFTLVNNWYPFDYGFLVEDSVSSITITADCAKRIDLDELKLERTGVYEETLEFDDGTNYLDGITATYSGTVSSTDMDDNRFISIKERTADHGTYARFDTGVATVANRKYYVSFDARATRPEDGGFTSRFGSEFAMKEETSVPLNGRYIMSTENSVIDTTVFKSAQGKYYEIISYDAEWKYYEGSFTPVYDNDNMVFCIMRTHGFNAQPIDIDNLKVWYLDDANNPVYVYSNGFEESAEGVSAVDGFDYVYDCDYKTLTSRDGSVGVIEYDVEALGLTNGIYTFSADVASENAGNTKVVLTLSDTTVIESDSVAVDETFQTVSVNANVIDGTEIVSVKIITDITDEFSFRKTELTFKPFTVIDTEDGTDYLDGTTVKVTGGTFDEITFDEQDGYITVLQRPDSVDPQSFLDINLGEKAVSGRTYYVSYDVNAANSHLYRNRINTALKECTEMNNNYVIHTENSSIGDEIGSAADKANHYVCVGVPADKVWHYFEGKFTPVSDGTVLHLVIGRGPGAYRNEFSIDNIKVWYYDNNNNPVTVYENSFDNIRDTESVAGYSNSPYEHVLDVDHTKYTPASASEPMNIQYALNIPEEDALVGNYVFKADIKAAEAVDEPIEITVTYTYEDGSVKTAKWNVTDAWNTFVWYRAVDKEALVSVTLSFTSDTAVLIKDAKLMIDETEKGGIPNIGIIMVLLKKRVVTDSEPEAVVPENINYIVKDDFEAGFDSAKVTNTYNGLAKGAWMNNSNYATKLEAVELKGNKVLSVSGIQTNWSGIAYGVGELQPGEYKVSVDIKLANASDSCGMRISVNSGANQEEYIASDNYDIHNIDGKKWTTVEYTFTVTEPTTAAVRIRGGIGGAPDTVPYYIDNVYVAAVK